LSLSFRLAYPIPAALELENPSFRWRSDTGKGAAGQAPAPIAIGIGKRTARDRPTFAT
jgi:hypothetical protein